LEKKLHFFFFQLNGCFIDGRTTTVENTVLLFFSLRKKIIENSFFF